VTVQGVATTTNAKGESVLHVDISAEPPFEATQRLELLLNPVSGGEAARSNEVKVYPATNVATFDLAAHARGPGLVRVRAGGAESTLTFHGGAFTGPLVTIP
jgi:hypothetical protein